MLSPDTWLARYRNGTICNIRSFYTHLQGNLYHTVWTGSTGLDEKFKTSDSLPTIAIRSVKFAVSNILEKLIPSLDWICTSSHSLLIEFKVNRRVIQWWNAFVYHLRRVKWDQPEIFEPSQSLGITIRNTIQKTTPLAEALQKLRKVLARRFQLNSRTNHSKLCSLVAIKYSYSMLRWRSIGEI